MFAGGVTSSAASEWISSVQGAIGNLPFDARVKVASAALGWFSSTSGSFDCVQAVTHLAGSRNGRSSGERDADSPDGEGSIAKSAIFLALLEATPASQLANVDLVKAIEAIVLPVLNNDELRQCRPQVCCLLSECLCGGGNWAAISTILGHMHSTLEMDELSSLPLSPEFQCEKVRNEHGCVWSFSTVTSLFPHLMAAISKAGIKSGDAKGICEAHVPRLILVVQSLMFSENKLTQQMATQRLLPSLLAPVTLMGAAQLAAYVESTWTACKEMLRCEGSMACVALGVVIRFADQLGVSSTPDSIMDVAMKSEFWDELRLALAAADELTQKRARFIVKSAWERNGELKGWKSHFLAMYDLLDEFALHFVKPNWHLMTEFDFDNAAVDLKTSEERTSEEHFGCRVAWLRILWQKAFSHRNHQVQRLAVGSFLGKAWNEEAVEKLGVDFVVGSLMPVLSQPALHGEASGFDIQEGMQSFLKVFSNSLPTPSQKGDFLQAILQRLSSDIPRLAIQSWIACFETTAESSGPSVIPPTRYDQTIDAVLLVLTNITSYHGTAFKLNLYSALLRAISAVVNPCEMGIALLGRLLSKLPDYLVLPDGHLHHNLTAWLGQTDERRNWLSKGMQSETERYFVGNGNGRDDESEVIFSDMKTWRLGADALVLTLCLGSSARCPTNHVLKVLGQNLQAMHSRPYLPYGTAAKTLFLLHGLLQAMLRPTVISEFGQSLASVAAKFGHDLAAFVETCCQAVTPIERRSLAMLDIEGFKTFLSAKQWGSCQKLKLGVHCVMNCATLIEKSSHAGEKASQPLLAVAKKILASVVAALNASQGNKDICNCQVEVCSICMEVVHIICDGITSCLTHSRHKSFLINAWAGAPDLELITSSCLRGSSVLDSAKKAKASAVSSQMLALAKWRCLDSAFKMLGPGLCSMDTIATDTKAQILQSAIVSVEYAPDPVLVLIFRCLRPLLKDLLSNSAFMVAVQKGSTEKNGVAQIMWEIVRSASAAFLDSRKHALMAAVFVNLAFLDDLFACQDKTDSLWCLHERDGPMFWLVEWLVNLGERSPRVMLLTTLKLSNALIRWPCLVELYMPHITAIILYGTSDKGSTEHRADPQGISNPELQAELAQIPKGFDPDLVEAYMTARVGPRVAIVAYIYELSKLALEGDCQELRVHQAGEAGRKLWSHLLDTALTDPQQTPSQYKTGSSTHRLKTRLWQALCVASNFLVERDEILQGIESLGVLLERGNVASVRMFMEATLTKLFLAKPDFMWGKLLPIIQDFTDRQEALPSNMLVGLQVALACGNADQLGQYLNAVLPWSLSHHHATRVFAQLAVQTLLVRIKDLESNQSCSSMDGLRTKLMEFFDRNPDMEKQRGTLGGGLISFHKKEIATPRSVFVSGQSLAGLEDEQISFEGAPESLLQKLRDFLTTARAKIRVSNQEQIMAKEAGSQLVTDGGHHTSLSERIDGVVDFQRKITPLDKAIAIQGGEGGNELMQAWNSTSLGMCEPISGSDDFADFQDAVFSAGRHQTKKRQGVIIVASLIDKVPNLAGLARTCEVFRAQLLVLADMRVLKDRQFTAISTTAEQWMPMEEVPPAALLPWLRLKRSQGYTLLGLEQTLESVVLPEYDFPRDCVIVLGREKEGIPAELLQVLDSTLEIPQLGIVRSLNVHVSGAVAVYEYSRQMRKKAGVLG